MKERRGFSYAAVLTAAFVLWMPIALFGGQGFSTLLALTAIPALFFVRYKSLNTLVVTVLLLTIWSAISTIWSAENEAIISGDLGEGNFSIGAAGLRIILTALAGSLVIAATLRIRPSTQITLPFILAILCLHALTMLAIGLFPETALALYAPTSDPVKEAPQNILRSANSLFLALPLLMGALWLLRPAYRYVAVLIAFLLAGLTFYLVGSDVALFGLVALGIGMTLAAIFQRYGFRILLGGVAVCIITAPVVLSAAAPVVVKSELPLSSSSKSRVFAWSLATQKVAERPITGHGIEASKEWRETFADEPELLKLMEKSTDLKDIPWQQYRILPGHPHNMGLQLWAEAGLVGVVMASIVLVLLAFALPPPASLGAPAAIATGGLIGTTFSLFSLSYSLWNEAFWANVALVAAALILFAKVTRRQ
ncbi:O-antigen ligase [Henriciella sp.]|uniref:O-antigen ligase family protein n=1 Tax=Henriciella sp. TaxID=1968823 RepID=UPI002631530C|nr:O-antigen ligase family protein [Henriciella sp.]